MSNRAIHYNFETVIHGHEQDDPVKEVIKTVFKQARDEESRVKIAIRVHPVGSGSSIQEHYFLTDANDDLIDAAITGIKTRLDSNPGNDFEGGIRINFFSTKTSDRYTSYSRTMKKFQNDESYSDDGQTSTEQSTQHGSSMFDRSDDFDTNFLDMGDEDDSTDEDDVQAKKPTLEQQFVLEDLKLVLHRLESRQSIHNQPVNQDQAMKWIGKLTETNFRLIDQNSKVTDKMLKLLDAFIMRFSLPQAQAKTERIIERVPSDFEFEIPNNYQQKTTSEDPIAPSFIPQIIQAIALFSGNPQAAALLQGIASSMQPEQKKQPQIPVKNQRIKGQFRNQKSSTTPEQNTPPNSSPKVVNTEPSNTFDNEEEEVILNDDDFGSDFNFGDIDEDSEDHGNIFDDHEDMEMNEGPPDITNLTPDQVEEAFVSWIQADPSRKAEVMKMIPNLTKHVM